MIWVGRAGFNFQLFSDNKTLFPRFSCPASTFFLTLNFLFSTSSKIPFVNPRLFRLFLFMCVRHVHVFVCPYVRPLDIISSINAGTMLHQKHYQCSPRWTMDCVYIQPINTNTQNKTWPQYRLFNIKLQQKYKIDKNNKTTTNKPVLANKLEKQDKHGKTC